MQIRDSLSAGTKIIENLGNMSIKEQNIDTFIKYVDHIDMFLPYVAKMQKFRHVFYKLGEIILDIETPSGPPEFLCVILTKLAESC